jgi:hypothetical protein
MHERLATRWRAVPGNHDVGDSQEVGGHQPFDEVRRARWLDVYGEDYWVEEVPGWRLLGVNALMLGSNLNAAADQEAFVAEAAAGIGDRHLALFLHKALFRAPETQAEATAKCLTPGARARIEAALGGVAPALVCSGHLHEHRDRLFGASRHLWAPAVACTIPEWFIPLNGGVRTLGYIDLTLHGDGGVDAELITPPGIEMIDIADVPEAYGDIRNMPRYGVELEPSLP